jgi:hypothetical protein
LGTENFLFLKKGNYKFQKMKDNYHLTRGFIAFLHRENQE